MAQAPIPINRPLTDQDKYLVYLTEKGMIRRYAPNGTDQEKTYIIEKAKPALQYELSVIISKGFSEYFLILADFCQYCHDNEIPLGPARGSAGGAVTSYVLGITEVDPLEFDLIFDRFLNSERTAMPDIDTDICWARRQEAIEYLVEKYGADRVAQIITFGTLSAKTVIQDVARVLKIPKDKADALKKLVPDVPPDGSNKVTIAHARMNPDFVKLFDEINEKEPRFAPAVDRLEGLHRHTSVHAGGVIISDDPMSSNAPILMAGDKKKKRQVVQYEMGDAEAVGLLKMDILGLKCVTSIDWAEKDVRKHYDPNFFTRGYRRDDQAAFDIINRGDTAGIFQLEGTGITRFAMEMKIETFNDIVALLALYRPGTLDSGTAQQYIDRKNGKEKVTYPHPDLEWILKDTFGIIVYQEQVMFVLTEMAGFTMGQADKMRKAMGKKDEAIMTEELTKFKAGALNKGYEPKLVDEVADLIKTFARYGFNKSHAVAYAFLTYWTAVLKARYADCFYAGWMNTEEDGTMRGWIIDQSCRKGVEVLPPDINISGPMFTATGTNSIRFGLGAVKGMGKSFVEKTMANRLAKGDFRSYFDYCRRLTSIPVDKKTALVGSGAFDFDPFAHRAFLHTHAVTINTAAKEAKWNRDPAEVIVEAYLKHYGYMADWETTDRSDPMQETLLLYCQLGDVREFKPLEMGELEKQYVNFYITADPIKNVQEELVMMGGEIGKTPEELRGKPLIGGRIQHIHTLLTKAKQQEMAFIDVDDGIVQHSITVFPQQWKRVKHHLVEGEYTAVKVNIGNYKGKPAFNAEAFFPIDMKNRDVDISIDMGAPNPLQIAQLKMLLDGADGGSAVVTIWMKANGYRFELKSDLYRIKVTDDMIAEIQKLFGPNSVSMQGK